MIHNPNIYQKWCESYDSDELEISFLRDLCNIDNKKVLEVGCGTGRLTFRIAKYVDLLYGVDKNNNFIKKLKSNKDYKRFNNISIECLDFLDYKSYILFDLVIFSWSLYLISDIEMALDVAISNLDKNGKIIILQPLTGDYERFISKLSRNKEVKTFIRKYREIISIIEKRGINYILGSIRTSIVFESYEDLRMSIINLNINEVNFKKKSYKYFINGKFVFSDNVKVVFIDKL